MTMCCVIKSPVYQTNLVNIGNGCTATIDSTENIFFSYYYSYCLLYAVVLYMQAA